MTLSEFRNYALNKKQIEYHSFSPNAKFQCADLANDYIEKVWGLKPIIGTDAKDFPDRLTPGMEFVLNTVDYLPEPGEIAIWNNKAGGGYGHIAVVLKKGLQSYFYSLDQNWSKPLFITEEKHTYSNVRGFIRKVQINQEQMSKELEACLAQHKDLITQLEAEKKLKAELQKKYEDQKVDLDETKKERNLFREELKDALEDHTSDLEKIAVLLNVKAEMPAILPAIETCITYEDKAREADKKLVEAQVQYESNLKEAAKIAESLRDQVEALQNRIVELEQQKPEITPQPSKSIWDLIVEFFTRKQV